MNNSLLGLGSIGKEVARLANAFGVKILYHKKNRLSEDEEVELAVMYRSFDDLNLVSLNFFFYEAKWHFSNIGKSHV